MGILRWARDVVVAQELGEPPALRMSADGAGFEVDLRDGGRIRLPVSRRPNPSPHPILKEIHACEVAGRTLEAESTEALAERVVAALETIAPGGRLPLLWFRAPATGYEVAAYRDGDDVACPVLGAGRRLKAPTVAALRREVTRNLVSGGQLHEDDELEVRMLRAADARRIAPRAVLSSERQWLPCVGDDGGLRTLDPVGGAPVEAGDLLTLLREARRRSGDARLHAVDVDPDAWHEAAGATRPSGMRLTAEPQSGSGPRLELEVRRLPAGDLAAAVDDDGIQVFLAADERALAELVGNRLARSGFVAFPGEVETLPDP
jgi:hypothetical protein